MNWLFARRSADGLSSLRDEAGKPSSPKASIPREEEVCPLSPARLLAKSLTDPETRGEWIKCDTSSALSSLSTTYHNELRDLKVVRSYSGYGGIYVSTPFDLSPAETAIVRQALTDRDKHVREERQKAALARLLAPAQVDTLPKGRDAKQGSVRSKGSAVGEADAPKGGRND